MKHMHLPLLYKSQETSSFEQVSAGCLNAKSQILTEDGPKTIKEVCENKYTGRVLSFSPNRYKLCFKPVVGHNIGEETDDWFELDLSDGTDIIATSNHHFWLEKFKSWKRLGDLQFGDVLRVFKRTEVIIVDIVKVSPKDKKRYDLTIHGTGCYFANGILTQTSSV